MFALKVIANLGRTTDALTSAQARFIEESFYMDDGMSSLPEPQDEVELLVAVVSYLKEFGLQAHKVVSNSREVMDAFGHSDEGAPPLINLDPNTVPRALGVTWNTVMDVLSVAMDMPERPFTRCGLLATVKSLFDPQGFAVGVVLGGRIAAPDPAGLPRPDVDPVGRTSSRRVLRALEIMD